MTCKILRKYAFAGRFYCQFEFACGLKQTLAKDVDGTTDEAWIQLALDWYADMLAYVPPDPLLECLQSVSDTNLVAEVVRRHLTVTVDGEAG